VDVPKGFDLVGDKRIVIHGYAMFHLRPRSGYRETVPAKTEKRAEWTLSSLYHPPPGGGGTM